MTGRLAAGALAGAFAAATFIGALAPSAKPKATQFIALLTAGQIPGFQSSSNSFGVAHGYLTEDDEFCFSISYDEPASGEVQAHIHGPATAGRDGPLEWDLTDGIGSPRFRCVGPVTRKQLRNLRAGGYYIVIHSSEYERGELRAQIVPALP